MSKGNLMSKEIVIKLDNNTKVVLPFVLENELWVCRASDECINDLQDLFHSSLLMKGLHSFDRATSNRVDSTVGDDR